MAAEVLNARDAKLVQWLQEAHAKEAEVEADLKAHIALTEKQSYKKRLRRHLTETREHKRQVARRIKQIGGSVDGGPVPGAVPTLPARPSRQSRAKPAPFAPPSRTRPRPTCETHRRSCGRRTSRSRSTDESRRSRSRWETARPRSWRRRFGATRSGWQTT